MIGDVFFHSSGRRPADDRTRTNIGASWSGGRRTTIKSHLKFTRRQHREGFRIKLRSNQDRTIITRRAPDDLGHAPGKIFISGGDRPIAALPPPDD